MPIHHAIWRVDGTKPTTLVPTQLESEQQLEDLICADIAMLDSDWMLIGRQVMTDHGKIVDLLALDAGGSLIVIELKKDKTPRDVVAQVLDYGAWAQKLEAEDITEIYRKSPFANEEQTLDIAFRSRFNCPLDEETLNDRHELVVVASSLDAITERIVRYLSERSVAINALFFEVFSDGSQRYLTRSWLLDPIVNQDKVTTQRDSEPWNGEYYACFGEGTDRRWSDARKYNFIEAWGGVWYTRTLKLLKAGDLVWVNIPAVGYVGVGRVRREVCRLDEYLVNDDGQTLMTAPTDGDYAHGSLQGDQSSMLVEMEWVHTVPVEQAVREVGFFGNQNTIARPRSAKWRHTVQRLRQAWNLQNL